MLLSLFVTSVSSDIFFFFVKLILAKSVKSMEYSVRLLFHFNLLFSVRTSCEELCALYCGAANLIWKFAYLHKNHIVLY